MHRCLDIYMYIPSALDWLMNVHFSNLRLMPTLKYLNIHSMMVDVDCHNVRQALPSIRINNQLFSTISRPTVGVYRTSIWGHRVRDIPI